MAIDRKAGVTCRACKKLLHRSEFQNLTVKGRITYELCLDCLLIFQKENPPAQTPKRRYAPRKDTGKKVDIKIPYRKPKDGSTIVNRTLHGYMPKAILLENHAILSSSLRDINAALLYACTPELPKKLRDYIDRYDVTIKNAEMKILAELKRETK